MDELADEMLAEVVTVARRVQEEIADVKELNDLRALVQVLQRERDVAVKALQDIRGWKEWAFPDGGLRVEELMIILRRVTSELRNG